MLKFSVKADGFDELHEAIAQACTKAEHIVALQARIGIGDMAKGDKLCIRECCRLRIEIAPY